MTFFFWEAKQSRLEWNSKCCYCRDLWLVTEKLKHTHTSGATAGFSQMNPSRLMECALLSGSVENMDVDERSLFKKVSSSVSPPVKTISAICLTPCNTV